MTSEEVRARLVEALEADLVGPWPEGEDEVLPLPPSRWYLTGFLAPQFGAAPDEDDPDAEGELAAGNDSQADAAGDADPEPKRRQHFPASMGLSVWKGRFERAADPYMTLLFYFNSVRELGGMRRLVEDEVRTRVRRFALDKRPHQFVGPHPYGEDRNLMLPAELTSRESTQAVKQTKQRHAQGGKQIEDGDDPGQAPLDCRSVCASRASLIRRATRSRVPRLSTW